jgi:hypothetical protein
MNIIKTSTINFIKNKKVQYVYAGICVFGGIGGAIENTASNIRIGFLDSSNPMHQKLREIDNNTLHPSIMGSLRMGVEVYHTMKIFVYAGFGFVVGGLITGTSPISIPVIYTYISYENELRNLFI